MSLEIMRQSPRYMEHDFPNQFDASVVMGFDYVKDPVLTLKKLLKDTKKEIYIYFPDNRKC